LLDTLVPEFEHANQAPEHGAKERAQAREP
jgi:hypothetical protein